MKRNRHLSPANKDEGHKILGNAGAANVRLPRELLAPKNISRSISRATFLAIQLPLPHLFQKQSFIQNFTLFSPA